MVSVSHSVFRVEGLLRFASKLACRYLRQLSRDVFFIFPIGVTPNPQKGHFAPNLCSPTLLIRLELGILSAPWGDTLEVIHVIIL